MPEPVGSPTNSSRQTIILVLLIVTAAVALWWADEVRRPKVGLVYSTGGMNENPFNKAAERGVLAVNSSETYGVRIETREPQKIAEMKRYMEEFAEAGYDLVFGVGFYASGPLVEMSYRYPETQFVLLDGDVALGRDNLCVVQFRHQGGAFLAGALAAMMTKSGAVGFIGGMETPLIAEFENGYRAGVDTVNELDHTQVAVLAAYVGWGPDAFDDPERARGRAQDMRAAGADVIFPAAGASGRGVLQLARDYSESDTQRFYAIGVDSDQDDFSPGVVLTSVMKRMERPLEDIVNEWLADRSLPPSKSGGYAEQWITLTEFKYTATIIGPEKLRRLAALRDQAVAAETAER